MHNRQIVSALYFAYEVLVRADDMNIPREVSRFFPPNEGLKTTVPTLGAQTPDRALSPLDIRFR